MTTTEATIRLIQQLPEEKLLDVQKYVKKLLSSKNKEDAPQPITKEKFLAEVEQSIADAEAGRVYTIGQVEEMFKEHYEV